MDGHLNKRRGPLGWLAARTWRFWFVVFVVLPSLYVASSGPARPLLALHRLDPPGTLFDPHPPFSVIVVVYDYWTPAYAPLIWLQSRYQISFLWRYWNLYPIPQEPPNNDLNINGSFNPAAIDR